REGRAIPAAINGDVLLDENRRLRGEERRIKGLVRGKDLERDLADHVEIGVLDRFPNGYRSGTAEEDDASDREIGIGDGPAEGRHLVGDGVVDALVRVRVENAVEGNAGFTGNLVEYVDRHGRGGGRRAERSCDVGEVVELQVPGDNRIVPGNLEAAQGSRQRNLASLALSHAQAQGHQADGQGKHNLTCCHLTS